MMSKIWYENRWNIWMGPTIIRPLTAYKASRKERSMLDYTKEELLTGSWHTKFIKERKLVKTYCLSTGESKRNRQEFLGDHGEASYYIMRDSFDRWELQPNMGTPCSLSAEVHDERHWTPNHCDDGYRRIHKPISKKKYQLSWFPWHEVANFRVRNRAVGSDLGDKLYQITITCAEEGKLAQQAYGDERTLFQPKENQRCWLCYDLRASLMLLTAFLVFDPSGKRSAKVYRRASPSIWVPWGRPRKITKGRSRLLSAWIHLKVFGLAHAAQLKILELTAVKSRPCMRVLSAPSLVL